MAVQRIGTAIVSGNTVDGNLPVYDDGKLIDSGFTPLSIFPQLDFAPIQYSAYPTNNIVVLDQSTPVLEVKRIPIEESDVTSNSYVDYTYEQDSTLVATFTTKFSGFARITFGMRIQMGALSNQTFAETFAIGVNAIINDAKIPNSVRGGYVLDYSSSDLLTGNVGVQKLISPIDFLYDFSVGDTLRFEMFWYSATSGSLPSTGVVANGFNVGFEKPEGGADYTTTDDFSRAIEIRTYS